MTLKDYQIPIKRAKFVLRDRVTIQTPQKIIESDNRNFSLFYEICEEFKNYYIKAYETNDIQTLDEESDPTKVLHKATIGDPIAVKLIKDEIQRYLSTNNYNFVEPPNYYNDLIDGIFEEQFGWGPLSVWKTMHDSAAAQVIGKDIWFDTQEGRKKADFSFESITKVRNVCERFKDIDRKNKLDEVNHHVLETKTNDNVRVSIMIPELSYEPIITLRRNITRDYSIEKQASLNTIPDPMIPVIKILSCVPLNSVIAGPPGSGKNTFLVSMLRETIYDQNDRKFYVESSFEWLLREIFPGAPLMHAVGKGEQLDQVVFPAILRHDAKTVIVGEIRQNETEIYGEAQERGIQRVIGTLHNSNPVNIPSILARLNIHYHRLSIDYAFEYIRFAENLHFSITMEDRNEKEKRVTGIQFYEVDQMTLEVKIVRVMDYDWKLDEWTFNDYIPQGIKQILSKKHKDELVQMQKILTQLKALKPMPEARRSEVALSGRV